MPAVTRKATGRGAAYHLATRLDNEFLGALTNSILQEAGVVPPFSATLPLGVTYQSRVASDGTSWLFLMNFYETAATVDSGEGLWRDYKSGEAMPTSFELPPYGSRIFTASQPLP